LESSAQELSIGTLLEVQKGMAGKHGQQSIFGFFSKAPAQPAAQNACAVNPAAAPEAATPEAMDVEGVHADAPLPASPSLHAMSMPAWASSQSGGSHSAHTTPLCCTMEPSHYPGVSLCRRGASLLVTA